VNVQVSETGLTVEQEGDRYECVLVASQRPVVTVLGNGYALIVPTPTGPVAVAVDGPESDRLFHAGVNYVSEVAGDLLQALQVLL
jgi:hypothetical protein